MLLFDRLSDYLEVVSESLDSRYVFSLKELFGSSAVPASSETDMESILEDKYYEYLLDQSDYFPQLINLDDGFFILREVNESPNNQIQSTEEDKILEGLRNFCNFHERTLPRQNSLRLLANLRQRVKSELVKQQAENKIEFPRRSIGEMLGDTPHEEERDANKDSARIGS